MQISTLSSDRKWPYALISLAIFMLSFAGSFYTHSPGHHQVHTAHNSQLASEHQHIQLSQDYEFGVDLLLHCGADIHSNTGLCKAFELTDNSPLYSKFTETLDTYFPIQDPPPPRFHS